MAAAPTHHSLKAYEMRDPLRAVLSWHGTMLPFIAYNFELWFFLVSQILLRVAVNSELLDDDALSMGVDPWKSMVLSCGMLTVFSVVLVHRCYDRYLSLHRASVGMSETLQSVAATTSVLLHGLPDARWNANRLLVASAALVYLEPNDDERKQGKTKAHEWDRLAHDEEVTLEAEADAVVCPALLTATELAKLKCWPGAPSVLLQTWALHVLRGHLPTDLHYHRLMEHVLELKGHCSNITTTLSLPIPFQYYHLHCVLTYFTYICLTLAVADEGEASYSSVFLVILIVIFSGLRELAASMANPFAAGAVGLPTEKLLCDVRGHASLLAISDTRPPGGIEQPSRRPSAEAAAKVSQSRQRAPPPSPHKAAPSSPAAPPGSPLETRLTELTRVVAESLPDSVPSSPSRQYPRRPSAAEEVVKSVSALSPRHRPSGAAAGGVAGLRSPSSTTTSDSSRRPSAEQKAAAGASVCLPPSLAEPSAVERRWPSHEEPEDEPPRAGNSKNDDRPSASRGAGLSLGLGNATDML